MTTSRAAAEPIGPPIRVVLRACGEIHEPEVERIVAAELGSEVGGDGESSDPTWIVCKCEGTRVLIEVGDVVSRKTLRRSFDFGRASPKARARLIAIASSELVLASWAELAMRPRLRVEPEGAPPSEEHTKAARKRATQVSETPPLTLDSVSAEGDASLAPPPRQRWLDELPPERRRLRITGLGSIRTFFTTEGSLLGGGLRLSEERLVLTSWSLDALFETGSFMLSGKEYKVDSWSLGGMLYVYGRARFITARIGAGLRAGLSATSTKEGMPPPPSNRVLTPWGWPMLATGLSLGRKPISFEIAGEGGYVAVPVAPTAQGGVSLRGIWFSAQLGLSLFL